MIRALRERHRRIFLVLTATLPAGYLGLLLLRAPHPGPLTPLPPDGGNRQAVGAPVTLLESPLLTAQLLAAPDTNVPLAVEVTPEADPAIPDLLLYWAPTGAAGGELPPDAVLVGALSGSRPQVLPLPDSGTTAGGHLFLYSGVRHALLGDTPLAATP